MSLEIGAIDSVPVQVCQTSRVQAIRTQPTGQSFAIIKLPVVEKNLSYHRERVSERREAIAQVSNVLHSSCFGRNFVFLSGSNVD